MALMIINPKTTAMIIYVVFIEGLLLFALQ
jgi:hypothetical protein